LISPEIVAASKPRVFIGQAKIRACAMGKKHRRRPAFQPPLLDSFVKFVHISFLRDDPKIFQWRFEFPRPVSQKCYIVRLFDSIPVAFPFAPKARRELNDRIYQIEHAICVAQW
jgi:hypothetical protein